MQRWIRLSVLVIALALVPIFVRWLLHWIDARHVFAESFPEYAGSLPLALAVNGSIALALVGIAMWWLLATLVFLRRSRDLLGNLLAISFLCFGGVVVDSSRFTSIARADDLRFIAPALMLANVPTLPWMFVFPSGRLSPRWASAPIAIWVGWYVLRAIVPAADPSGNLLYLWLIAPLRVGRASSAAASVQPTLSSARSCAGSPLPDSSFWSRG
jgi:hypothetical protein